LGFDEFKAKGDVLIQDGMVPQKKISMHIFLIFIKTKQLRIDNFI